MTRALRSNRQPFSALDWIIIAGIMMLVMLNAALVANYFQEREAIRRSGVESACLLTYMYSSPEWQHCIDAR